MIGNVDWFKILYEITATAEKKFNLSLTIEGEIAKEIEVLVKRNLASIEIQKPNVAKVAGIVAFWIRKLKPIGFASDSKNKLLTVNEYVSLMVGLSICHKYFDDASRDKFKIHKRILKDWISSFRYHSHSPHSSLTAFEILSTST